MEMLGKGIHSVLSKEILDRFFYLACCRFSEQTNLHQAHLCSSSPTVRTLLEREPDKAAFSFTISILLTLHFSFSQDRFIMFGTSEISVSSLFALKHLAALRRILTISFLPAFVSFSFSSSKFRPDHRSRDSSRTFSNGSAPNSEKRLLINLAYRAPANSSAIPASCIYSA